MKKHKIIAVLRSTGLLAAGMIVGTMITLDALNGMANYLNDTPKEQKK